MDFNHIHLAITKLKDMYKSPVTSFGMGGFNAVVANDYATCKEMFNNPSLQDRVPAFPALLRTFGDKNG